MSASPLSPDGIRAAAQVHQELGPEYSDAVVESFLAKIDQEIGARIDARLARLPRTRGHHLDPAKLARRRTLAAGAAIGAVGAGVPLSIFAFGMAANSGQSDRLVAIWIVLAVVFVVTMLGAGIFRFPDDRGGTRQEDR